MYKSDGVSFRTFRITDYDEVLRLWKRTEGVGLNESDTRSAIATFLRRNPQMSFVALKHGKIVGAVLCGHDGRRGYLHHLAVARRYRKQGIARQLVAACLAKLKEVDIHKCSIFVYANNVAGMSYWKHNGWKLRDELRIMQFIPADADAAVFCRTC